MGKEKRCDTCGQVHGGKASGTDAFQVPAGATGTYCFMVLAGRVHALEQRALLSDPSTMEAVRDLLAVVHRDGGHYTEEVGLWLSAMEARHKIMVERGNEGEMQNFVELYLKHSNEKKHCDFCNRGEMNPNSHTVECPLFYLAKRPP